MILDFRFTDDNRGVAALLVIVIVGAAALIMAYSASILGLGELDMGYVSQRGGEASAFAEGCVEESLRQLQLDSVYNGETLNLDGKTCIISVASNGNDRTITVSAYVDDYSQDLEVEITLNSGIITLNSWQEI